MEDKFTQAFDQRWSEGLTSTYCRIRKTGVIEEFLEDRLRWHRRRSKEGREEEEDHGLRNKLLGRLGQNAQIVRTCPGNPIFILWPIRADSTDHTVYGWLVCTKLSKVHSYWDVVSGYSMYATHSICLRHTGHAEQAIFTRDTSHGCAKHTRSSVCWNALTLIEDANLMQDAERRNSRTTVCWW